MSGLVRTGLGGLLATAAIFGTATGADPVQGQVVVPSTIRGRVLEHETDRPLPGALVSLTPGLAGEEGRKAQPSGDDGEFLFLQVPPGSYRLEVVLLGYHDLVDTLVVDPGSELALTLPLSASPVRLEPLVVVTIRQPGPMIGFEMRRQTANGFFMTREEIEATASHQFTDLLRRVPGARIVPTGFGSRVYFRTGCVPDLWVDGTLANTTPNIDSFLRPEQIAGIEVYRGADLPIEFGSNLCGAIVVWTRDGRPSTGTGEKRSLVRQLIVAGSFVVLSAFTILLSR